MNKKTFATLTIIGILLISYGVFVYVDVPPSASPRGIDAPADVDNTAAWLAGVIVMIGFGAGLIFWAIIKTVVVAKNIR